ncbi:MAG: ATP-binding cassette domain-containing protein, partial [Hydrogenophaga sp.]
MLEIKDLHAYYGKSHVLHGVSFDVGKGEIVALMGRNGSGRSTTAKAIMGLVDCTGALQWRGQSIQGKKPFEIAHLGLGYVPENRDIFPKLTVHQNLLLGQKGDGKGAAILFNRAEPQMLHPHPCVKGGVIGGLHVAGRATGLCGCIKAGCCCGKIGIARQDVKIDDICDVCPRGG